MNPLAGHLRSVLTGAYAGASDDVVPGGLRKSDVLRWMSRRLLATLRKQAIRHENRAGISTLCKRGTGRDPYYLETNIPGLFAAGDVRQGAIKRCASAVGEGSMAVAFVNRYLSSC
jgi:NADPH-dependent glutamate synthase beta subunit-like oxidoreductase